MNFGSHDMYVVYFTFSTIGFRFWKVGSGKIFAVNREELRGKGRKRGPVVISDSESDGSAPQPLQRRKLSDTSHEIAVEVREMRKDIQCLFQITEKTKISPGISVIALQLDLP